MFVWPAATAERLDLHVSTELLRLGCLGQGFFLQPTRAAVCVPVPVQPDQIPVLTAAPAAPHHFQSSAGAVHSVGSPGTGRRAVGGGASGRLTLIHGDQPGPLRSPGTLLEPSDRTDEVARWPGRLRYCLLWSHEARRGDGMLGEATG